MTTNCEEVYHGGLNLMDIDCGTDLLTGGGMSSVRSMPLFFLVLLWCCEYFNRLTPEGYRRI